MHKLHTKVNNLHSIKRP